jgi:hypothetical protein
MHRPPALRGLPDLPLPQLKDYGLLFRNLPLRMGKVLEVCQETSLIDVLRSRCDVWNHQAMQPSECVRH